MRSHRLKLDRAHSSGFTVLELLSASTVIAVALSIGIPAMQDTVLDARLAGSVRSFVTAVQLARNEAAKRGDTVVLCQTQDLSTCAGGMSYSSGWIVFTDVEREAAPQRAADELLLRAESPALAGSILSNRAAFEFRPFTKRSTNGTVTFCDRRGAEYARAVVVSYTGRPRVTLRAPGDKPLSCPGGQ